MIPLMLGMTLLVFIIANWLPGDPVSANLGQARMEDPEIVAAFREKWGLDQPLHVQYLTYLGNMLRGDLGTSIKTTDPVASDLARYFPASVELAIAAVFISLVLGIPLGILSAVKRNHPLDHGARFLSLFGVSAPVFWLALVALYIFYLKLGWLPGPGRLDTGMAEPPRVTGMFTIDSLLAGDVLTFWAALRHLFLPSMVLGLATMGLVTRMTRSSMLEVLHSDYIRTARSKGLSETRVIGQHAFRNALIPVVTVLGLSLADIMAGAVLTETIFAWPGIGRYAFNATISLDFPAIMGVTLLIAAVFAIVNLVVDIVYMFLDPRLRNA